MSGLEIIVALIGLGVFSHHWARAVGVSMTGMDILATCIGVGIFLLLRMMIWGMGPEKKKK